jgi:hypothetical protein
VVSGFWAFWAFGALGFIFLFFWHGDIEGSEETPPVSVSSFLSSLGLQYPNPAERFSNGSEMIVGSISKTE